MERFVDVAPGVLLWAQDSPGPGEPILLDLAPDALRVLDAFDVRRAHIVGMGPGGLLAQLLMLDHPDRLSSTALLCSTALPGPPGICRAPIPHWPGC